MPNLSPITVYDGNDTPVAHVFNPASRGDGSVAIYTESDGTPIGDNKLTLVPAKLGSAKRKAALVLSVPVTDTMTRDGVELTVEVRTGYARVEFTFDSNSTTQERDDIITMVHNALAPTQTQIRSVLEDLEGVW